MQRPECRGQSVEVRVQSPESRAPPALVARQTMHPARPSILRQRRSPCRQSQHCVSRYRARLPCAGSTAPAQSAGGACLPTLLSSLAARPRICPLLSLLCTPSAGLHAPRLRLRRRLASSSPVPSPAPFPPQRGRQGASLRCSAQNPPVRRPARGPWSPAPSPRPRLHTNPPSPFGCATPALPCLPPSDAPACRPCGREAPSYLVRQPHTPTLDALVSYPPYKSLTEPPLPIPGSFLAHLPPPALPFF